MIGEPQPQSESNVEATALFDLLPPDDDAAWLPRVQKELADAWRAGRTERDEPIVCALANDSDSEEGHLSLPCSIADDDQAIEQFLAVPQTRADPITFARLFLLLLDDFVETIQACHEFLGAKKAPRAPDLISTWTNNWAKHRRKIAILHHPAHLFLDHPDAARWEQAARAAQDLVLVDNSWFKGRRGLPDPEHVRANDQPALVIVPRLNDFLSAATTYYDEFVQRASGKRDELKRFATTSDALSFETLLDRIVPHLVHDDVTR